MKSGKILQGMNLMQKDEEDQDYYQGRERNTNNNYEEGQHDISLTKQNSNSSGKSSH
jgi:hypothetical protein